MSCCCTSPHFPSPFPQLINCSYVAGNFDSLASGTSAKGIFAYDGANWHPLANGSTANGVSGGVNALTVWDDGNGEKLYIGGKALFGQSAAVIGAQTGKAAAGQAAPL